MLARPPELSFDSVAPRRRDFAREYAERAAAEGFDPSLDPHLAFDIILGTAIAHLLATGRSMSDVGARQLADVVLAGLRAGRDGNVRAAGR